MKNDNGLRLRKRPLSLKQDGWQIFPVEFFQVFFLSSFSRNARPSAVVFITGVGSLSPNNHQTPSLIATVPSQFHLQKGRLPPQSASHRTGSERLPGPGFQVLNTLGPIPADATRRYCTNTSRLLMRYPLRTTPGRPIDRRITASFAWSSPLRWHGEVNLLIH